MGMGCRRKFSRKFAAQRAKRMAGQGLGPLANKQRDSVKALPAAAPRDYSRFSRRDSPSYEPYR